MTTAARLALPLLLFAGLTHAQPLDVLFVVETSPGSEHATDLVRAKFLADGDRAGVVAFHHSAETLEPLTADQRKVEAALQEAGARAGGALNTQGTILRDPRSTAAIASAIRKACAAFPPDTEPGRKRAIVLLFGSEDPQLAAQHGALEGLLASSGARLFAVAVQRADPIVPQARHSNPIPQSTPRRNPVYGFPALAAQLVGQLAKASDGEIHKRAWNLKKILAIARRS